MSHHAESLSLADDASVFNELPNINLRMPDPARINNSHLDDSNPSFLASTPYDDVVGVPYGYNNQTTLTAPDLTLGFPVFVKLIWFYGPWNVTFRYDCFLDEFNIITAYLRTLKLVSLTHIRLGELCVVWTHKKMAQRGKIIEKFVEHTGSTYYWIWIFDCAEVELVHEKNICLYPVNNPEFRVPPTAFSCYEYGIFPNRMLSSPGTLDWCSEVIPSKEYTPTRGLCKIRLVQAGYDGDDQHFRRMWPRTKDLIRFPVNIMPPDMYWFRDRLLQHNTQHINVGVECLDKDCSRMGFCIHQPFHPAWQWISYLDYQRYISVGNPADPSSRAASDAGESSDSGTVSAGGKSGWPGGDDLPPLSIDHPLAAHFRWLDGVLNREKNGRKSPPGKDSPSEVQNEDESS